MKGGLTRRFTLFMGSLFEAVGDLTRKLTEMNEKYITGNFAELSRTGALPRGGGLVKTCRRNSDMNSGKQ